MATISLARPAAWASWVRVLRLVAAAEGLALLAVAAALGDAEAAAVAAGVFVALFLTRVRFAIGTVLLGMLFADVAFFTGSAALTNLFDRAAPPATIVTAGLAAIALIGLPASVVSFRQRTRAPVPSATASAVVLAAAAAFAIVAVAAIITGAAAPASAPEVLRLESKGTQFSTTTLTANGRSVTVRLANRDLFWHTFTIDKLGVDLKVPVGGEKELRFSAPPGTYTYYCAIPGHASAGMRGTLTVR